MSRWVLSALILCWAAPAGAAAVEARPEPLPVAAVPLAPAERAARLLADSALVLRRDVPRLPELLARVPQRARPDAELPAREAAARAVLLAQPLLEAAAPSSPLAPEDAAAVLSGLYDRFRADGLLADPAPATDLARAAAGTGLSPDQLGLIARHSASRGFVPIEDFLRAEPTRGGGYLLGTTDRSVYARLSEVTGLTHFVEAYQELFGRVRTDVTNRFLDFITRSGDAVAFLVPPQALAHPETEMTKNELLWLFERPERMASISFVLGAYEFLGTDPEPAERALTVRALELWRGGLERGSDAARWDQRDRHRAFRGEAPAFRPKGARRLWAIEHFLETMVPSPWGEDRVSTGRFVFPGARGTYMLHRGDYGYCLDFPAPDGPGRWEVFVSKRGEPGLYGRVRRAYQRAS